MLMNMKTLLQVADEHHFAVPAFNIGSGQILKAVMDSCEKLRAPVILSVHPLEMRFQGNYFIAACVQAANTATVPVVLHLDHGSTQEEILLAIRHGFTSVMIDASQESFEDNIEITKSIVHIAAPLGISVEAELGTVGSTGTSSEGGAQNITYTDPDQAFEFIQQTGIDTLAIAIGTAHGLYPKGVEPKLELNLLKKIKDKVKIPLVLHGGSNNSDDEIAQAVALGVNKINISSDVKSAFYKQVHATLNEQHHLYEPDQIYRDGMEAMKRVIEFKINLFNDADKAKLFQL